MENKYREAKRHVERKIGFFIHLTVYLMVNSGLILFNLLHHPGKFWAFGPLFGWGIGLLFHGAAVFLIPRLCLISVASGSDLRREAHAYEWYAEHRRRKSGPRSSLSNTA